MRDSSIDTLALNGTIKKNFRLITVLILLFSSFYEICPPILNFDNIGPSITYFVQNIMIFYVLNEVFKEILLQFH